jgi:hypothetical protein
LRAAGILAPNESETKRQVHLKQISQVSFSLMETLKIEETTTWDADYHSHCLSATVAAVLPLKMGGELRVFLIALGISKEELWKGPPPPSDAQQVAKICLVTCREQERNKSLTKPI